MSQGSIRSISADRSTPKYQPLPEPLKQLKEIPFESRYKLFSARRRSLSLPRNCEFRSYKTIYEAAPSCVAEEENEHDEGELESKNSLPSVLDRTHLPINYEQFSNKRHDEIENITQLAKDCYNKFKVKPHRDGYELKDSKKKHLPPESEEAFKRRYMHNDYISGSHLQPKNLSPFDEIHGVDGEAVLNLSTNPRICYYYINTTKGKFLDRYKKSTQRRNYITDCHPKSINKNKIERHKYFRIYSTRRIYSSRNFYTKIKPSSKEEPVEIEKSFAAKATDLNNSTDSNIIEVKNFKISRVVPFKSYSDHIKESLPNQPNSVPFSQKRTYSMLPSKTYKLDSNGVPNPIHQSNIVLERQASTKLSPAILNSYKSEEEKCSKKFNLSCTHRFYSSRIIDSRNSKFIYNPKIDPYSVLDEKRNVRHRYMSKTHIKGNDLDGSDQVNSHTKPEKHDTSTADILLNTNTDVGKEISYVNPAVYPKIDDIRASLNKTLPIDQLTDVMKSFNNASNFEAAATKTFTTSTDKNISGIRHSEVKPPMEHEQTRSIKPSATYKVYKKLIFGPVVSQLPTPSPTHALEHTCESNSRGKFQSDLSKPNNLLSKASIVRNYSTSSGSCKKEKKTPTFPNSRIPKEVIERHKLSVFDGICDPTTKTYGKTKPCICVEPFLPSKLPKLKRLQKRLSPEEIKEHPNHCNSDSCPPRADHNLKEKKKSLPSLPCSNCPCIEPPPLHSCNPLPRLTKRFVPMDQHEKCTTESCPPRADEKLVEKKKCLKPLPPSNCKCKEPYLPTKLPPLKRLEKKPNIDEAPVTSECNLVHCPPRADDGKNLYHKKVLPRIEVNDCPCVEPYPLDECAPLPRLKRRPVFQDAAICKNDTCPLKADDVCGYEEPKRKLKPLLPCIKTTGYYKNYSTMTGNFLNVKVAGLKTSAVCEINLTTAVCKSNKTSAICKTKKDMECKESILPICPPEPCVKPVVKPMCPPKKKGLLDGVLQKVINYFKARPNCPPPDEWKKRYLREKAEKAAKAAGLELCEPKCKVGLDLCKSKPKTVQKDPCNGNSSMRHYSSSNGAWNRDANSFLTGDNKQVNKMELKHLIYRILKLLRVDDKENTSETCDRLLQEFLELSEEEFQYIKAIINEAHESIMYNSMLSFGLRRNNETELEQKMVETLDLFCKKAGYLRNITYLEYEELEKMKTRAMQDKLDEMLNKYKVEEEC